jgi:hypothetical protein
MLSGKALSAGPVSLSGPTLRAATDNFRDAEAASPKGVANNGAARQCRPNNVAYQSPDSL